MTPYVCSEVLDCGDTCAVSWKRRDGFRQMVKAKDYGTAYAAAREAIGDNAELLALWAESRDRTLALVGGN